MNDYCGDCGEQLQPEDRWVDPGAPLWQHYLCPGCAESHGRSAACRRYWSWCWEREREARRTVFSGRAIYARPFVMFD